MSAPWGSNSYATPYYSAAQPQTSSYNAAHSSGMPQPHIPQPQQMPAGFYNPALSFPRAFPSPQQPQRVPTSSTPHDLPPSLRPGVPGSVRPPIHRSSTSRSDSDNYFVSPAADFPQPGGPSPQIRYTHSAPPPPLPRIPGYNQPPLPPKPSFYPPPDGSPPQSYIPRHHHKLSAVSPPQSPSYFSHMPQPPPPEWPSDEDEEEVMKRVLAESMQESEARRLEAKAREDEELARAMRESLSDVPSTHPAHAPVQSIWVDGSDRSGSIMGSPVEFPQVPSPADMNPFSQQSPDSTPATSPGISDSYSLSVPQDAWRAGGRQMVVLQISEDEAFARRLAEEEEIRDHSPHHSPRSPPQLSRESSRPPATPFSAPAPAGSPHLQPEPAAPGLMRSTSAEASIPTQTYSEGDESVTSGHSEQARRDTRIMARLEAGSSLAALTTKSSQPIRPASVASSAVTGKGKEEDKPPAATPAGAVAAGPSASSNQYVDDELLWGVSMGWGAPVVTPAMKPMQGQIPNVVALPYGKSAPFHIRAPSWRHMLKLLARLGNTRLEPSVEAIAEVKTVMQLRVVVSFVKTHETLSDWNTVLFMSIDQPVPPNVPNALRYRSGETGIVPYSYSLSTPLPLLREGPDAPMSKFYTIPNTQKTPYPSLPITFPNLATYLASALDDSRGAHDSSTGMRKLAKHIDAFYPNEGGAADAAASRQGMGQKLMSFVGFGARRMSRDRNAETFDLVTPFVADDYGH